jgi:hypothetical protein
MIATRIQPIRVGAALAIGSDFELVEPDGVGGMTEFEVAGRLRILSKSTTWSADGEMPSNQERKWSPVAAED